MSLKQAAAIARRAQRKIDKIRRQIVERAAPWHALPTAYLEFEIAQKVLEKLERENERN